MNEPDENTPISEVVAYYARKVWVDNLKKEGWRIVKLSSAPAWDSDGEALDTYEVDAEL